MSLITKQEKFRFWIRWTLLSAVVIPWGYIVSLFVVGGVHFLLGFGYDNLGTPFSNSLMHITGGIVLGIWTGFLQYLLLLKLFRVNLYWMWSVIIGFVLSEIIAGFILWRLDILRGLINVVNSDNPFPEAAIFAFSGLIIGLIQWPMLHRYFKKSGFWVMASMLGWGICIVVTIISDWAFFLGALLYGAITGATLVWILQQKK